MKSFHSGHNLHFHLQRCQQKHSQRHKYSRGEKIQTIWTHSALYLYIHVCELKRNMILTCCFSQLTSLQSFPSPGSLCTYCCDNREGNDCTQVAVGQEPGVCCWCPHQSRQQPWRAKMYLDIYDDEGFIHVYAQLNSNNRRNCRLMSFQSDYRGDTGLCLQKLLGKGNCTSSTAAGSSHLRKTRVILRHCGGPRVHDGGSQK